MIKRAPHKRNKSAYQSAQRAGKLAEILIYCLFAIRGWRLVKWRYQTPFGELDLIIKRGSHIRFIEVKYRQTATATAFPSKQQQQRICKAAAYFLKASHLSMETPCRFGFVLLQMQPTIQFNYIQHQKHAWSC